MVKKRSTENFKAAPYVTTLLSTSLWIFYGLLKPGGLLVVTVNGAGAVLQAVYVTLFLVYAPKDTKVTIALRLLLCASRCPHSNEHIRNHSFCCSQIKTLKLVAALDVGFLAAVIFVTLFAIHGDSRLLVAGFLCAGLTIGMYASPLSSMVTFYSYSVP